MNDREIYEGFITSIEIIKLKEDNKEYYKRITFNNKRIKEIQKNCDHIYKLYAKGLFKDFYICTRCGYQEEH